jgi:hypothetical protein
MLNYQKKETIEIPALNINVRAATAESKAELIRLQKARTKANRKRKPAYQAKIDAHFGLK